MIYLAAAIVGIFAGWQSGSVAYCTFCAAVVVAFIWVIQLLAG